MYELSGKRVAIIGRLSICPRRQAIAQLEIQGGLHQERVNSRTDYVVVPETYGDPDKTKQLLEAKQLQERGCLRIISEGDFVRLLQKGYR